MLTFLRKIRKSLIESLPSPQVGGSTRKYLLYAIGEIALVVIGILIALQINNWNEARKDKLVQLHLLEELQTTAQEDYRRNQFHLNQNDLCLASLETLINHLENKLPFDDSLSYHFSMAHNRWMCQVKKNAYENAKDHGLDFIANNTTKYLLTNLYENKVEFLEEMDRRFNQFYYLIAAPELANSFSKVLPQGSQDRDMVPQDYSALLSNENYMNVLKSTRAHLQQYKNWQQGEIIRLLRAIQNGLESEIARY